MNNSRYHFMKHILFICFLLIGLNSLVAQADSTAFLSIPVPENCTELAVDEEYNLILLNPEQGLVHKVLAPDYDSTITAGGRGVRTEGLLSPTRLAVFSRQRIFVLDEDQRKAVVLSANLRPAEAIDFLDADRPDESPDYPIDIVVSPAGELYVLDGLNGKVYMYDAFGKLRLTFGGQDYGDGALYKPVSLAIDGESRQVWVLDTARKDAVVYSRFGEYLFAESYHSTTPIEGLELGGDWRIFYEPKTLIIKSRGSNAFRTRMKILPPYNESVHIVGNKLYVLRGNEVHLQNLK